VAGKRNGELLRLLTAEHFAVFRTTDQNLPGGFAAVHLHGRLPAFCRTHHKSNPAVQKFFMLAKSLVDGKCRISELTYEEHLAARCHALMDQVLHEGVLFPGEKSNWVEIGQAKRFHNTEEFSEGLPVLF
jgi:hypothetical protein